MTYNENGGYMSSQRNGHHSGGSSSGNNNMQQLQMQMQNNNYGLNDGSGTIITGYSGSGMEPVDEKSNSNISYGQYAIGQLLIELTDEHVDSNGRLELTCLATIPAQVGPGEQYADYKTSLKNGKSNNYLAFNLANSENLFLYLLIFSVVSIFMLIL